MALADDDRRALVARLSPAGGDAVDAVADAVEPGEELREVVVDAHGDVVVFTDRRALFAAAGAGGVTPFGYDEIQVRRRDAGLAIDALIEGGRLVLEVARSTFIRLGVIASGGPPGRATWLPVRAPVPRPAPAAPPHPLTPTPPTTPPLGTAPAAPPHPLTPTPPTTPPLGTAPPPPVPTAPPPPPTTPDAPAAAGPPPPLPLVHADAASRRIPPGWYADPASVHWWRWWDGIDWTAHVADGGPPFLDPLPPRPPSPPR